MTNSATASTQGMVQRYVGSATKHSDGAPMVITRLSGWIDVGEAKSETPAWIIRTAKHETAR